MDAFPQDLDLATAGAPLPLYPRSGTAAVHQTAGEESWDNEGGSPVRRFDVGTVTYASGSTTEIQKLQEQIRSLNSVLSKDFAAGLIGRRHGSFEHRYRVLRQLTARLDKLRSGPTSMQPQS